MFDPSALLSVEEAQAIEQTLLPSTERFLIRVAMYSLRSLTPLAQAAGIALKEVSPSQIDQWLSQDPRIQAEETTSPGFQAWYGQFLIAALTQLNQAAQTAGVATETLTLDQVIQWFTIQAQQRLQSAP